MEKVHTVGPDLYSFKSTVIEKRNESSVLQSFLKSEMYEEFCSSELTI